MIQRENSKPLGEQGAEGVCPGGCATRAGRAPRQRSRDGTGLWPHLRPRFRPLPQNVRRCHVLHTAASHQPFVSLSLGPHLNVATLQAFPNNPATQLIMLFSLPCGNARVSVSSPTRPHEHQPSSEPGALWLGHLHLSCQKYRFSSFLTQVRL